MPESLCGPPCPASIRNSEIDCEVFDPAACADKCEFVFLAGESGLAMKIAPGLLEAGKKIVDLSADFRLEDPDVYKEWYKAEHTAPHLLDRGGVRSAGTQPHGD